MAILTDVARNPAFAGEEIERARAQAIDAQAVALSNPAQLAGLAANRLVYRPTRRRLATYALLTAIGAANVALSLVGPAADRSPYLEFGIALMLFAPAWRAALRLWLLPVIVGVAALVVGLVVGGVGGFAAGSVMGGLRGPGTGTSDGRFPGGQGGLPGQGDDSGSTGSGSSSSS